MKKLYRKKWTALKNQAICDFVVKHLTDDEFDAFYGRDFKKVSEALSRSMNHVCGMEANMEFFQAIQKLYWNRTDIDRHRRRGSKVDERLASEYNDNLADAKRQFPKHDFPVFLDLDHDPTDAIYMYHVRLWNKTINSGNRTQVQAAVNKLNPVSPFEIVFYEYGVLERFGMPCPF